MPKRNAPCPCGSNIKYKKCCGAAAAAEVNGAADTRLPPPTSTPAEEAQYHYRQACDHVGRTMLPEAIASFRKALAILPAAEVYYNLAVIEERAEKYDDAISSCLKAVELKPELSIAHELLGKVYRQTGRYDDAIFACRQAISSMPEKAELYNSLGQAQKDSGSYREALASFERAKFRWHNYREHLQPIIPILAEYARVFDYEI